MVVKILGVSHSSLRCLIRGSVLANRNPKSLTACSDAEPFSKVMGYLRPIFRISNGCLNCLKFDSNDRVDWRPREGRLVVHEHNRFILSVLTWGSETTDEESTIRSSGMALSITNRSRSGRSLLCGSVRTDLTSVSRTSRLQVPPAWLGRLAAIGELLSAEFGAHPP